MTVLIVTALLAFSGYVAAGAAVDTVRMLLRGKMQPSQEDERERA